MQELDHQFFEEYKRLDRLCSDMYQSRSGVSRYIEHMESTPPNRQIAVSSWKETYKTLKHLRWVRNQIAHTPGENLICCEQDITDVIRIYQSILSGQDPLATVQRLSQNQQHSTHRKTPASQTSAVPVSSGIASTQQLIGCFAWILLLSAGFAAALYFLLIHLF